MLTALTLPQDWRRSQVTYTECGWPAVIGRHLCLPPAWSMNASPPADEPGVQVHLYLLKLPAW